MPPTSIVCETASPADARWDMNIMAVAATIAIADEVSLVFILVPNGAPARPEFCSAVCLLECRKRSRHQDRVGDRRDDRAAVGLARRARRDPFGIGTEGSELL